MEPIPDSLVISSLGVTSFLDAGGCRVVLVASSAVGSIGGHMFSVLLSAQNPLDEGVPMSRLLLAALLLLPVTTHAANQNVLGDQLLVKNPSTPDKRKITVKAKELT